jgi:Deoxyribonuclease II
MLWIGLKGPSGCEALVWKQGDNEWSAAEDVNTWLSSVIFSFPTWTHYAVYNDEDEQVEIPSSYAHAKGILLWRDEDESWLWVIHSVPKWPLSITLPTQLPRIPQSECEYGQSFALLKGTEGKSTLSVILEQLAHMRVHIKFSSLPIPVPSKTIFGAAKTAYLTSTLHHVAKDGFWNKDFFEEPETIPSKCMVETWMRPPYEDTTVSSVVTHIKWPNAFQKKYYHGNDHSKLAFSASRDDPWVYVGDVNRQKSQRHRGGGGFIIRCPTLHRLFEQITEM